MTQLNTQLSPLPCHFLRPNVSTALSFRRPASCNDATQVVIVRLGALKTMTMKTDRYVTSCGLVDTDGRFTDSYLHYWRRYTNVSQEPAASYRGRHIDVSEKTRCLHRCRMYGRFRETWLPLPSAKTYWRFTEICLHLKSRRFIYKAVTSGSGDSLAA
jgi:hypothetical protein